MPRKAKEPAAKTEPPKPDPRRAFREQFDAEKRKSAKERDGNE